MSDTQKQTSSSDIRTTIRQHYGKAAAEFKPNVSRSCCGDSQQQSTAQPVTFYETPAVADLPEDVTGLSMGCGDPITLASLNPGQTVLDLGSGGGIDCFLAAKAVGETGYVIGVDMTAEMLEKARANKAKLGFKNVDFRLGEIEHLPVADGTVDVIISNCVINLSPDKPQVFREAFRVLRSGGKIAFSDIVTDGPLPQVLRENLNAWAECVSGALPIEEYRTALEAAGFVDITVTPVYFDQAMVDEVVKQATPQGSETGCCKMVLSDGTDVKVIDLDKDADLGDKPLDKLIFSAKITARKS